MGFYQQHILPRLIHGAMRQEQLVTLRSSLIAAARGRVLEIGIGSGLNIPFYSRDVTQVIGIDPSRALARHGQKDRRLVPMPRPACWRAAPRRCRFPAGRSTGS